MDLAPGRNVKAPHVRVARVSETATHALRDRVLRNPRVHLPEDDDPAALHFAAMGSGTEPLGVISARSEAIMHRPSASAFRFYGLAVDIDYQGRGIGRLLVEHVVSIARSMGAEVVWASGRDSAAGFYRRLGFQPMGDGFVGVNSGLPHHVVLLELTVPRKRG